MKTEQRLLVRFRCVLGFFIVALILSGITAFPLVHELRLLSQFLGIANNPDINSLSPLQRWIWQVRLGLENTYRDYPFIAYGTDWLAFGHIAIAIFFVGAWLKPKESNWILISGMIACLGVIPLALICGLIRGIPFYWRLIDCSFGIIGIIPLLYCYRLLGEMRKI